MTPKGAPRTTPADSAARAGRLRKARQFKDAAELISDFVDGDDGLPDVYVSLAVHAGIAAADVLCMDRLGEYSRGQNHDDAVDLLAQVDRELARRLKALTGLKSKAQYATVSTSAQEIRAARHSMEALTKEIGL